MNPFTVSVLEAKMVSKQREEEILKGLHDAVVAHDEEAAIKFSESAVEVGVDAYAAIMSGLASGMGYVGELYDKKMYFVPELLLCSDAFNAGLSVLKPHVKTRENEEELTGHIVIGVVQGDIHEIGKNLVAMMFDAAGWTVYDLGRNVPHEKFVDEAVKSRADVVGMSALMTTSMLGMPRVIKMLKRARPDVITMVGGAPINPEVARLYEADGYAPNAGTAVRVASQLLRQRKQG